MTPPPPPPPPPPTPSSLTIGNFLSRLAIAITICAFVTSFAFQELNACFQIDPSNHDGSGGDDDTFDDDGDDWSNDDDGGKDDEFYFGYDVKSEPGSREGKRLMCALKAAAVVAGKGDNLLLALAMLPTGRNSIFTLLLDVDWRDLVTWHKMAGRAAAAGVLLHVVLYQLYWILKVSFLSLSLSLSLPPTHTRTIQSSPVPSIRGPF